MGRDKQVAKFVGTFALVFFGCGAAVVRGMGSGPTAVNLLGIASAFGFAIVAMAYGIGPISGCHVNPAVSFGVYVVGRMSFARAIKGVPLPKDHRDEKPPMAARAPPRRSA
jgi:aquaporin Z